MICFSKIKIKIKIKSKMFKLLTDSLITNQTDITNNLSPIILNELVWRTLKYAVELNDGEILFIKKKNTPISRFLKLKNGEKKTITASIEHEDWDFFKKSIKINSRNADIVSITKNDNQKTSLIEVFILIENKTNSEQTINVTALAFEQLFLNVMLSVLVENNKKFIELSVLNEYRKIYPNIQGSLKLWESLKYKSPLFNMCDYIIEWTRKTDKWENTMDLWESDISNPYSYDEAYDLSTEVGNSTINFLNSLKITSNIAIIKNNKKYNCLLVFAMGLKRRKLTLDCRYSRLMSKMINNE